jgi:scyllo-inositol 2-dehydrogenase (NADP+)
MNGRRRVAIIGAGNITSLRHIPALQQSKRVDIVGVVDRHLARAEKTARSFSIPNAADTMDAPWFASAEAVSIGVPPGDHFSVAREALLRDKHVLLEKPMTLRVSESEELVRLAEERKKILAVIHNFQFARSAVRLKKMIADGRMGAITGILCFQTSTTERRLPSWHEDLPLGLFYDEAPHLLYLLKAFGGAALHIDSVAVSPSARGRRTPGVITAHIRAGSVPAVLYNNFEAPVSEWQFIVYGEKALASIDVFRDVLVVLPNDGQHLPGDIMRTTQRLVSTHLTGVFTSGVALLRKRLLFGNEEIVRRFLDAIETGEPPRDMSGADGLAIVRLQHELIGRAGVNVES